MISNNHKAELISLVKKLGQDAEEIKKQNILKANFKDDSSPVTEADLHINKELEVFFLKTNVKKIISEEKSKEPYSERKKWDFFWIVDPIDGTKEFMKKGNDYTINIALCFKQQPIFSLVYAPAREEFYHAEIGRGSFKNDCQIKIKNEVKRKIKIAASSSHLNEETKNFIDSMKKKYDVSILQFGSSLKICKVAEGIADIYPRFGPTMEWDTCAADLILNEAGGSFTDPFGKPLKYNKINLVNPYFLAKKPFIHTL